QLSTDPVTPLQFTSIQQADRFRQKHSGTGKPIWFAIHGTYLEFVPVPDSTYTVEMTYYAQLAAMSADTDTNWLLTHFPDAYLYGSLLNAAPYLQDDERLMVWERLYEKVLAGIQRDSDMASTSASTPLSRTPRTFG
ncbi:MAG: phage adaptor protein, partial [Mycobacterium sp.]